MSHRLFLLSSAVMHAILQCFWHHLPCAQPMRSISSRLHQALKRPERFFLPCEPFVLARENVQGVEDLRNQGGSDLPESVVGLIGLLAPISSNQGPDRVVGIRLP